MTYEQYRNEYKKLKEQLWEDAISYKEFFKMSRELDLKYNEGRGK